MKSSSTVVADRIVGVDRLKTVDLSLTLCMSAYGLHTTVEMFVEIQHACVGATATERVERERGSEDVKNRSPLFETLPSLSQVACCGYTIEDCLNPCFATESPGGTA